MRVDRQRGSPMNSFFFCIITGRAGATMLVA